MSVNGQNENVKRQAFALSSHVECVVRLYACMLDIPPMTVLLQ